MAMLFAYFDESGKYRDHSLVTFCGVCAHLSKVEEFDRAWTSQLHQADLKSLHMKHASDASEYLSNKLPKQTLQERFEALKPFADCINDHFELGLMQAWDVEGFGSLSEKARKKLGNSSDPYYSAFALGAVALAEYVRDDARQVSLVCDEDQETASTCYARYMGVRAAHDGVRDKIVSLTFADDESPLALQAADMVAYLFRREARSVLYGEVNKFRVLSDYLTMERGPGKIRWMETYANKERLKKISDELSS